MAGRAEGKVHPGTILAERFLAPLGISAAVLAEAIGLDAEAVRELVDGRRHLSADTAARLGLYFGVPARWWSDLQPRYDALDDADVERLRAIVEPFTGLDGFIVTPEGVRRLPEPGPPAQPTVAVPADSVARLRAKWRSTRLAHSASRSWSLSPTARRC